MLLTQQFRKAMFSHRLLTEHDYPVLCQWWRDNRFTPPAREMLPDLGAGGFMVDNEGLEICAGFLYMTNSNMAWIEYVVANFQVKNRKLRREALKYLIEQLGQYAKNAGYRIAFTSLKNEHLKKRYMDVGYMIGTENTTELVKIL